MLGFGHGVQFILREALRSGPRYRPRRLSPAKLPVDRMPVLFVHSNCSGVVEAWFVLSDWLLLTCVFLSRFQIHLSMHAYRCILIDVIRVPTGIVVIHRVRAERSTAI